MKYLKLFQNHGEYQDFLSGDTIMKPNVSHCVTQKEVHYNPRESIVRGIIRTSDFDKIVYGNGEGYVQYSSIEVTPSSNVGSGCQYKTNLYYYKNFDLIQRENNVNISTFITFVSPSLQHNLFVTYSQDEYENVKRTNAQATILLAQDGSLVSVATCTTIGGLYEETTLPYYIENGDCIRDENTDKCMPYNGKYDVHVSYAVNLINPDVNAVLSRYTILQDDGIPLPSKYYSIYFNEQDFQWIPFFI